MGAPSSDSAAIRQTLRALKAANVVPIYAEYGDGDGEDVTGATEQATIDAIMAVDDCYLIVEIPPGAPIEEHPGHSDTERTSHIRFVMGNDPEEVICDHGTSLSYVLDPLTEAWWSE